jgi:peroxiredoxin family protein
MKIPNPWPRVHSQCTCRTPKGDVIVSSCSRGDLEVPDDATEVTIQPVKIIGRGGEAKALGQPRIWSKAWGLMDIEDHLKKMDLANKMAEAKAKKKMDKTKASMKKVTKALQKPREVKLDACSKLEMTDGMTDAMGTEEHRGPSIGLDDQGMYKN